MKRRTTRGRSRKRRSQKSIARKIVRALRIGFRI